MASRWHAIWRSGTIPPAVIFVTAYDEHALEAFEVRALDYLMKPVRAERLVAALARAERFRTHEPRIEDLAKTIGAVRSHVTVSERGRMILVPVDDIVYLRAELKYVTIRTAAREHLTEESLTSLESEFGERFVRIHRNALVARKSHSRFPARARQRRRGRRVVGRPLGSAAEGRAGTAADQPPAVADGEGGGKVADARSCTRSAARSHVHSLRYGLALRANRSRLISRLRSGAAARSADINGITPTRPPSAREEQWHPIPTPFLAKRGRGNNRLRRVDPSAVLDSHSLARGGAGRGGVSSDHSRAARGPG